MVLQTRKLITLIGVCFFAVMNANAANLNDVSFASLPGDRVEISLIFDETPPEVNGYTIEKPARIALDLPGASSKLAEKYHNLGMGNAKRMTVIGTKDRTRVILDLVDLVPYSTRTSGNTLFVLVGSEGAGEAYQAVASSPEAMPAANTFSRKVAADRNGITNIDFQRGEKGDGQIVVSFASPDVDIDMSEVGGHIQLRMPKVDLPMGLRQRLDVVDFATPVRRIDSDIVDGDALIRIKASGHYDYLAYQADNKFTVSVEALTEEEVDQRKKDKFPFTGEKLSLNFQNIEVRAVLQLIADFTSLNLVASDTVGGSITLRLQNVPWDQALELILKTKGLDKRTVGNVLLVAPAEEIAAREKLELEANRQVAALAPVRLEIVQINYAKAADIVELLRQDSELISERGFISSDERTNTISVRETSEKQEQIRKLISTWDIPVRQVLIEARIVRARSNIAEEMGIQWGGGGLDRSGDNLFRIGGSSGTLSELTDIANGNSNSISFPGALAVDLGVTRSNSSSLAIGFGGDNYLIDMELSAFESDGKGEIVAQPKIVTADRQTATIKSGEEIPYQEASSSGATSVSFKEAVLSLEVTPQITPDDQVIMDLKINQDNRGEVTAGIPSIETNEVLTQVLVGNGETVVLGGIFQSERSTTVTKTPFLGDIPYLGALFTKTEEIDERAELLIFITPKLLKNGVIDQQI
ncbi:fimbrial protein [Oleiphilus sp. HI0081]|nr:MULTISPECIES: type IV pilus secretin PilQ family protein [unclassified Oleiphilus]KZY30181.1 fimbrial protein [Oleiphilus sp. HI0043]KZY76242.1 fimbrial protein [Oleiphilus sp. HI0068]KZY88372.1 fimbrial protein [Oleiphilus sp. HI0069]KZY91366.1 fimbrial protein [Oleiphilus sp. HI0072]KZZ11931.1 fimbrial protein [Oleiphilus sp. HI0078]KZZ29080.1 fimbrial protein [Oleiphilus sp. HI0081]KZZ75537.1 fimbrial protein [Oleiphilus sp. HI0132]